MKTLTITSAIENNNGISEFLNSKPSVQKFYINLADVSIGITKTERRQINKLIQDELDINKKEAYDFINFIKQFILSV